MENVVKHPICIFLECLEIYKYDGPKDLDKE